MRAAIIENGKVVNVIVVDELRDDEIEASDDVSVGWSYDGRDFAAPEIDLPQENSARPDALTRRQFFIQLELSGLTSKVAVWVAAQPKLLQIAFNESGSFKRDEPAMQAGFAALGFTAEQIDGFFEAGSKL